MANIPEAVQELAEFAAAEDIILAVLRERMPAEVPVQSVVALEQTFPFVLVRRLPGFLSHVGDDKWVESIDVSIHTFVEDPDGDRDAAILGEACRVILRDAWLSNWYEPTLGSIVRFETTSPPRRVPDWATAAGPVQYADLPSNVWRYEGRYRLIIRKPRTRPYPLP